MTGYRYLIHYIHQNGQGRCFLSSNTPLDTEANILAAEKDILQIVIRDGCQTDSIGIINIIPLRS